MLSTSVILISVGSVLAIVTLNLICRIILKRPTENFHVWDFEIVKVGYFRSRSKECHICLGKFTFFKPGYSFSFCENDLHPIHWDCIVRSLERKLECPVCRSVPVLIPEEITV